MGEAAGRRRPAGEDDDVRAPLAELVLRVVLAAEEAPVLDELHGVHQAAGRVLARDVEEDDDGPLVGVQDVVGLAALEDAAPLQAQPRLRPVARKRTCRRPPPAPQVRRPPPAPPPRRWCGAGPPALAPPPTAPSATAAAPPAPSVGAWPESCACG